jgi:NAD(P)-dependent dehydrogenase (short-subunit alcohol dehydrogenase family)
MTWNIEDKLVLITGATDGIGKKTASNIAGMGAQLVLVGRNEGKTKLVVEEIKAETGNQKIEYLLGDLSVQKEVRRVADEFCSKYDRLDVLYNNVGATYAKRELTIDGVEKTFALNQLSYFLLTHLLLDKLEENAPSRIICTSSGAHRKAGINLKNVNNSGLISIWTSYGQSKLANIMFVYALARRLEGTGVTVNSLNPGLVRTNIGRGNGKIMDFIIAKVVNRGIPVEEGSETPTYLISSDEVEGVSGKYFDKKVAVESKSISNDIEAQEKLWEICKELTGIEKYC